MYWGEVYTGLTLVLASVAAWRQHRVALYGVVFLLAQLVVRQTIHDYGDHGAVANAIASVGIVGVAYVAGRAWPGMRIWGRLCLLQVLLVPWHLVKSLVPEFPSPYAYAAGINIIYLVQLVVVAMELPRPALWTTKKTTSTDI